MVASTGYEAGGGGVTSPSPSADKNDTKGYWSHARLKRAYNDYLDSKRSEIDEQQDARRFVHGSQWTAEQLKQLNLRKQPAAWENITARKIHGVVGTLERLKQDPKAYPRTPKHEEGAELATAALRYALDTEEWDTKDPICSENAAIDGIGGIEFGLTEGDQGDREISLDVVYVEDFFYDPRSRCHDFSDARYLGVGKWLDLDAAIELYPDQEDLLTDAVDSGEDLTTNSDRENRWFQNSGDLKQLRLVECWYKMRGQWCWCVFTGVNKIAEGKSPFLDENEESEHKYEMFSAYIDQDGDRYGLVRNLKPLNQAVNMRKSKALHELQSRRIFAPNGAFEDIEVARREAARPDGVVIYNPLGDMKPEFDDARQLANTEAQFKFYELERTAIESFGPNIAVTGEGLENSSGRAIHLLQQAGLADLGPFIQSYRGWKIRTYRKMWNAIQRHWTGERWIRVTDDDDISQFIQVNGVGIGPDGQPQLVNALGSLDVDIILDEGPDSVNQMGDAYDTLTILAQKGAEIPPAVLIELSPLPMSVKKRIMDMLNPQEPDPKQQAREQLEMQMASETVREKGASADLKHAQAIKTVREAEVVQPEQPDVQMADAGDHPLKTQSEAADKVASARLKEAQTAKVYQDIELEPQRMAIEAQNQAQERMLKAEQARRTFEQQQVDSDRNYKVNMKKATQKPSSKGTSK